MADYLYKKDGKIHTRYSELRQCTPKSVSKVLDIREKLANRYESAAMAWGTDRHGMWEEESRKTGKLPEVFGLDWNVDHIEAEFTTELLPGMVVHSRPDAVCVAEKAVIDYKTLTADYYAQGRKKAYAQYHKAKQLSFYAFQLGMHGIEIRKAVYLVEIWDRDQVEILGYRRVERDLDLLEISKVLPWTRERLLCLAEAVAAREAAL